MPGIEVRAVAGPCLREFATGPLERRRSQWRRGRGEAKGRTELCRGVVSPGGGGTGGFACGHLTLAWTPARFGSEAVQSDSGFALFRSRAVALDS